MFRAHVLIVRKAKLYYTVSGIIHIVDAYIYPVRRHLTPQDRNLSA